MPIMTPLQEQKGTPRTVIAKWSYELDLDLTCLHIQGERSGRAEQHRGDNELHLLLGFSKRCGLKRGSNKVGGENNCHKRYNGQRSARSGSDDACDGGVSAGCRS